MEQCHSVIVSCPVESNTRRANGRVEARRGEFPGVHHCSALHRLKQFPICLGTFGQTYRQDRSIPVHSSSSPAPFDDAGIDTLKSGTAAGSRATPKLLHPFSSFLPAREPTMAAATPAPPPAPSQPLSWDDQIVPALRKKLEAESAQLSQRISVLDNPTSSSSSRGQDSENQGWHSVGSHQYLASNHNASPPQPRRSPSSVYATPTRRASQRAAANLDSPEMLRAKERARIIRERKMSGVAATSGQALNGITNGGHEDEPQSHQHRSSSTRQRTQSTPMKYQNHVHRSQSTSESSAAPSRTKPSPRQLARAKAEEVNARDRERDKENESIQGATSDQSSMGDLRRRAPGDGVGDNPRLPTAGPSNYHSSSSRLTRSGSVEPATSLASKVVPTQRSTRAATEPPLGSKNSWDEVLPPAIARRVAQEELLRRDPSLASVEGLIDTWDREGLPLSQRQVDELVENRRQREKREWEERERDRMREMEQEEQKRLKQLRPQVQLHPSSSSSTSHPLPRLSSATSQPMRNISSSTATISSHNLTPQPPTTSSSVGANRTLSSSSSRHSRGDTTRAEDGFEMVQIPRQQSDQRGRTPTQTASAAQPQPQTQQQPQSQSQPQSQRPRPAAHQKEKNDAGCCACIVM